MNVGVHCPWSQRSCSGASGGRREAACVASWQLVVVQAPAEGLLVWSLVPRRADMAPRLTANMPQGIMSACVSCLPHTVTSGRTVARLLWRGQRAHVRPLSFLLFLLMSDGYLFLVLGQCPGEDEALSL